MKISAVILAKNEERHIKKTLESISFCDEVILIDNGSTDRTVEIVEKSGAIIYGNHLKEDFAALRNFGLEKAVGEWVLFVDADEEVTEELRKEIEEVVRHEIKGKRKVNAYYIKRRDFFWGRELRYGEVKKARDTGIIRLVKKNSGRFEGKVHEVFVTKGKTNTLESFLNHYPHQTVSEFLERVNYYSTIRAKELLSNHHKSHLREIIGFPLGKFILTYFFKFGFADGAAGFAYAFFMAFHSFLVRVKLYQYKKFQALNSYNIKDDRL